MSSLRDLQRDFRAAILSGEAGPLADLVRGDGLRPEQRLRIYRNNNFTSLTEALKATYPVVCRLVDERFFAYAASSYIRERPPTAPCLDEYGADFADFLAVFPPTRSLAYLPDVARLEWAINCAYHGADAPVLDPVCLTTLSNERYPSLVLTLQPSCHLLQSAYPVDRIWRAHQPDGDLSQPIDPAAGGCRLLIHRRDLEVAIAELDAAGFAFVAALADGRTLQRAYEVAASLDDRFDLAQALGRQLARGVFSGFVDTALERAETP